MDTSRLEHLHDNRIGETNRKHLSFDARARVSGRCFLSRVKP